MRRRLVPILLIVVSSAMLAGCFLPMEEGSLDMQSMTDEQLAHRMSRNISDGGSGSFGEIAREAIENGSATADGAPPAADAGYPFVYHGRYYNLTRTTIGQHEETAVSIEIDYNASDTNGTAVEYDRLPASDKHALAPLLPVATTRRIPGNDLGTDARYSNANRSDSVLLGPQQYDIVIYNGTRYPLTVKKPRTVTVFTFRYTATKVADDSAAYAQQLKASSLFTLSNLSDDERDIVKKATDGRGYMTEDDDNDAFKSLSDRFRAHPAITRYDSGGRWLVRYHGTVYLADLDYSGYTTTTESETTTSDGLPRTHY